MENFVYQKNHFDFLEKGKKVGWFREVEYT